jgi:2-dehydropantoate 2-reductase
VPHRELLYDGMNQSWSKIAVVGAGAIGCYFGGLLARAGATVTLIGRRRHVDAINQNGLLFQSGDRKERIAIAAAETIEAVRDARLILFCVKSTDTDDAARVMAPHLADDAVILSLQNGVDNVERIRSRVKNPVICGLVYAAAEMAGPGWVRHTGGGDVIIGRIGDGGGKQADGWLVREIATLLASAGLRVKMSEDIAVDLWTKLIMNCAYNAICALSGARYGQMVAMPEVRDLMRETVDEVLQVAHAKGVRLPENIMDSVIKLADSMPQTMSSTAQDIAKGKRTEIDHLNGFVVRQGEALGIATPVNQTLNALMKLLEETKLGPAS